MKSSHSAGNTYFFLTIEAKRFEVFPLGGENYKHKKLNWEKVARMRRKRGARRLKISADNTN